MENGVLEYDRISSETASILFPASALPRGIYVSFGLESLYSNALGKFSKALASKEFIGGSRGLMRYLETQTNRFEEYGRLVEDGFPSALSSQVYSALHNAYSPFLVFLKYCSATDIVPYRGFLKVKEKILRRIRAINTLEEVSLNLAILFGRRPNRRRYESSLSVSAEICRNYASLEKIILSLQ